MNWYSNEPTNQPLSIAVSHTGKPSTFSKGAYVIANVRSLLYIGRFNRIDGFDRVVLDDWYVLGGKEGPFNEGSFDYVKRMATDEEINDYYGKENSHEEGKQNYLMLPRDRYSEALEHAYYEILRARKKHGENDFHGAHHGYAILLEEVDEAWDEIKVDNREGAIKEMIQVAAMAARFVAEI